MAYKQQAGRANVESAAVNYLTDGDKKKKKKELEYQALSKVK